MGMPIFGMDPGPVRPMGKGMGYDDRFDRTLDMCKPAVSQNTLKVISTFTAPEASGLTIGGVLTVDSRRRDSSYGLVRP